MTWRLSLNEEETRLNLKDPETRELAVWDVQLPNKEWVTLDASTAEEARALAMKMWSEGDEALRSFPL